MLKNPRNLFDRGGGFLFSEIQVRDMKKNV